MPPPPASDDAPGRGLPRRGAVPQPRGAWRLARDLLESGASFEQMMDRLLVPAQYEIGERLYQRDSTISDEHPGHRNHRVGPRLVVVIRFSAALHDDFAPDDDPDHDRLTSCAYWRSGQLFEQRTVYCRKACRSRQHKWERTQERKAARAKIRGAE